MPQVPEIPENARLTIPSVMELTGLCRGEAFKRCAEDHPRAFTWALAPHTGRGPKLMRVVDARSLPPDALKRWQESQLAGAFLAPSPAKSQALTLPSEEASGQMCLLAIHLPTIEQEDRVSRVLAAIRIVGNGAAPTFGVMRRELIKQTADKYGLSPSSLYRYVRVFKKDGVRGIVKCKSGPAPAGSKMFTKPGNTWMAAAALQNHRAGLPFAQNLRCILKEIEEKQPFHPEHKYDRPAYHDIKAFIRSQPPINEIAREKGSPGLHTAAGYCDRLINEAAGDTWCIDEWKVDGHVYLDWKMREVIRPFILTIIDERSEAILGWKLVVNPNPEAVLDLTEECLRKCWKPLRWYSDRGPHFRAKVGRHFKEIPTER